MARYDPFSPTFDHPLTNSSPDYGSRNGSFRTRPVSDFGAIGTPLSFRERNKRLRNLDDEKNQLIEDLLYQLESTQNQLEQIQMDHSREKQYLREGQMREASLQDQLGQVKTLMNRDPFLMVLIDGDGTVFTKDLLAKGEKGGKEAATSLWNVVNDFASQHLDRSAPPKIVVRIYANVKSLSDILTQTKAIDRSALLDDFIRGFNSTNALFDFVDAGSGEDGVRDKIRDVFRLHLYDCHCRQVVLGCSHDNDYSPLLEEIIPDQAVLNRVTLLEGVPFEKDMVALKSHFKTTKFVDIFQSIKLGPPSTQPRGPLPAVTATRPVLSRVESHGTNGTGSSSGTPVMTWASMTAQPFVPSANGSKSSTTRTSTPSSMRTPEPAVAKPAIKAIERNRHGQRVDKVDITIPNHEIQRIKKLKLCNIYYLQGPEHCTSNNCSHSHTYPLSKGERNVLREVARMTPCYYKLDCEDPECIYGHRCPQNKPNENSCYYGQDCRFWGWGHGIDTRVVKTTRV